ncbi:hypothetical protein ACQB6R_02695 [Propionibacteriaceae bacterium G1746]|uniref:hypothetical protein n=1 Tax=Aestuariimicrobium sp. G57 TaxID=3418485 RepID=UPI003C24A69C
MSTPPQPPHGFRQIRPQQPSPRPRPSQPDQISHEDVEALIGTRRDLGADYELALIDSFTERIEHTINARAAAEVARRNLPQPAPRGGGQQTALGIISVVMMVPIAITLGVNGALFALVLAVLGIVGVNVAHAWFHRR